jgi:outer membrane protein OmpA-like peptidoglycan-associated protein
MTRSFRCAVAAALVVVPLGAQGPSAGAAIQIPLREGLTVVAAYRVPPGHNIPPGDYEPIVTVIRVDATDITVALSTDEQRDACRDRAAQADRRRTSGLRVVRREDLEQAHALREEFEPCPSAPERHPGSTAISVSASVLRELNARGQTTLDATTTVAGMVAGVLTRIERGTVPFRAIVNDEPVELKAVHASWQSRVGAREYWILDDAANALVLRATYRAVPFWEVVKLSYPVERTAAVARIARALAKDGRTAVYGIYFDFASDRIKAESEPTLADIAGVLQQNPSWSLAVEGHTDNVGGDSYNLDLSRRRAAAVKQALVARYKVDGLRLRTNGYGASRPKEVNDTVEGRARNRRVELVKVTLK